MTKFKFTVEVDAEEDTGLADFLGFIESYDASIVDFTTEGPGGHPAVTLGFLDRGSAERFVHNWYPGESDTFWAEQVKENEPEYDDYTLKAMADELEKRAGNVKRTYWLGDPNDEWYNGRESGMNEASGILYEYIKERD